MELNVSRNAAESPVDVDIESVAEFIAGLQKADGEIPWSAGGKTDPWDHVESAMGLGVAGYLKDAERAYEWMSRTQLKDGSWWSSYRDGVPEDKTKDTNFSSYLAVGVFHYYLLTDDLVFLKHMWPTLKAGIDFAVSLQAATGEIYWAKNSNNIVDPMALLTGCSSVYMSIKCALAIAYLLGKRQPAWRESLRKLGLVLRNRPDLFNMTKSRYSLDWYYPVLCGALTGIDAHRRIDKYWDKFVVPEWGVRCVSDQSWVTMAETSELVLALVAIEKYEQAEMVFNCLKDKKYDDGSYWMGVTFPDSVIWPEEKTSWTAASVLLAHDALHEITPACSLFSHSFWGSPDIRSRAGELPDAIRKDKAEEIPVNFTS